MSSRVMGDSDYYHGNMETLPNDRVSVTCTSDRRTGRNLVMRVGKIKDKEDRVRKRLGIFEEDVARDKQRQ